MKHSILEQAIWILAVPIFAGAMFDTISQARDLEAIKKSGEIRICIAPLTPALAVVQDPTCRDNCRFSGPVYREAAAVAASLNNAIRPVFRRVDWDEQFFDPSGKTDLNGEYTPRLMSSETCDVYPTHLTKNDWRMKKLDFAVLFKSRMMVLIRKERIDQFKTERDLAGKIAAVEKNTSFHTWLREQNDRSTYSAPVTVHLLPMDDCLAAVQTGNADFTLVDVDIALWNTAHRYNDLVVSFPVGPIDEIGWAFRKEDRNLRDAVQAIFDRQAQDGSSELNRIWKEEFGVTLIQMKALIHAAK